MDAPYFDRLTCAFASPSRRGLLRGLAAAWGFTAIQPAEARTKRKKRRQQKKRKRRNRNVGACPGDTKPCNGACIPREDCCGNQECGSNAECVSGRCACLSGFEECRGGCVPAGDCCASVVCPDDTTCVGGACICTAAGATLCDGRCTDVATDGANCGVCGAVCGTGTCTNGACLCVIVDDCPAADCACGARKQGGFACFRGGSSTQQCAVDDDCPLGSFCVVTGLCAPPCVA